MGENKIDISGHYLTFACQMEFKDSEAVELSNDKKANFNNQYKTLISVMEHGANRNGSFMSKETVDRAIEKSLHNIPIVGSWHEDLGDGNSGFAGHGSVLKISDVGIEEYQDVQPYGYISDNPKTYWETVEYDGEEVEVLFTEGNLFYDYYKEQTDHILKSGAWQSMEIYVDEGNYDVDENIFVIDDFTFSALCILNKDEENPEYDVEPCFPTAQLEILTGGKKPVNKMSVKKRIEDEINIFNDNLSQELILQSRREKMKDNITEPYVLLYNDKQESVLLLLNTEDNCVYTQTYEIAEDEEISLSDVELVYTVEVDEVDNTELEDKYNKLKEDFTTLEKAHDELVEYKINAEKDSKMALIDKFDDVLSKDFLDTLRENIDEYSEEELDDVLSETEEKELLVKEYEDLIDEDNADFVALKSSLDDYTLEELQAELDRIYGKQERERTMEETTTDDEEFEEIDEEDLSDNFSHKGKSDNHKVDFSKKYRMNIED